MVSVILGTESALLNGKDSAMAKHPRDEVVANLPVDDPAATKVDDGSPDFELGHNRDAMITGPAPSPTRTYDYEIGNGRRVDGDRLGESEVDPYAQVKDQNVTPLPRPDYPADVDARDAEHHAERVRDFHGLS